LKDSQVMFVVKVTPPNFKLSLVEWMKCRVDEVTKPKASQEKDL